MSLATDELNGDTRLSPGDRLRYLWRNALRNCGGGRHPAFAGRVAWQPADRGRPAFADATPSPGRAMAERFFVEELPRLLPPGEISVLEIGCGSGRARALLARAGYTGRYTGIDVQDRFDRDLDTPFVSQFRMMDAHAIEPEPRFDLVISNSALEHIPDDAALAPRLAATLCPGGLQLHIVPAGAALWTYLWHGYRQYSPAALAARFAPERTTLYALGGLASLSAHLVFVTLAEMLLRLPARRSLRGLYVACVRGAFALDRVLPVAPVMYAVCARSEKARTP